MATGNSGNAGEADEINTENDKDPFESSHLETSKEVGASQFEINSIFVFDLLKISFPGSIISLSPLGFRPGPPCLASVIFKSSGSFMQPLSLLFTDTRNGPNILFYCFHPSKLGNNLIFRVEFLFLSVMKITPLLHCTLHCIQGLIFPFLGFPFLMSCNFKFL